MAESKNADKLSAFIFGRNIDSPIENKIFILMTSLTFTALFLGNFVNIIYSLPVEFTIFSYTATTASLVFYILSRNRLDHTKFKPPYFIASISLMTTAWFFNDGINGGMVIIFLVYFTGLYAITPSRKRKGVFSTIIILLPSLIAIQHYFPEIVISYESDYQRYSDLFFTSILFMFFLYILIDTLIKKYEEEHLNSIEVNKELQSLNKKLRIKNLDIEENNIKLRKNEAALRQISDFQKAILDNAPYAIVSSDLEGIINVFNPAAEKMLRYSKNEILGKATPLIFHKQEELKERAVQFSKELNHAIKPDFEVFSAKAKINLFNESEWTLIRKDGKEIIVFLSVTSLYNESGEISGYIGIMNDITKKKETERNLELNKKELEEREEKYRTLFEESREALLLIDNYNFIDCNNAALEMLKFNSKEEILHCHPSRLSPPIQPDGSSSFEKAEEMMNLANSNGNHRFEWVHRKADGEDVYVEVSLTQIPFRGRKILHSTWHDITDRKKMIEEIVNKREEAEKANQLKSEFLAQMSHEIRSPISSILNFTSLIEDMTKTYKIDDIHTCFSSISNASSRIIRTIDSILNMSELQLGTYQVSKKKISIAKSLKDLVDEYWKTAEKKGLSLNLQIENPENAIIENDEYAVNQIFANLIDNAIKYTDYGKIEVYQTMVDNKIEIYITDTGKGISEEYLPYLFDPFTQQEQGYTRKYDGNGLGMSLVKKYCDLVGAYISVKSTINVGTEFKIVLKQENIL